MNVFSVYVLIKKGNPIYIGCTQDVKRRISQHKKNHSFDKYVVIKNYQNKRDAFNAENSILRFCSLFLEIDLKNSLDVSLTHKKLYINE